MRQQIYCLKEDIEVAKQFFEEIYRNDEWLSIGFRYVGVGAYEVCLNLPTHLSCVNLLVVPCYLLVIEPPTHIYWYTSRGLRCMWDRDPQSNTQYMRSQKLIYEQYRIEHLLGVNPSF